MTEVQTCALPILYNVSDTVKPVAVDAADMEGRFRHSLSRSGKYLLKAEYVGLKTVSRFFTLSAKASSSDLGTIALASDSETLGEVVVTGQRRLVDSDGATLTYNVEEDPSATTMAGIHCPLKCSLTIFS